jgi:hypothetical protein
MQKFYIILKGKGGVETVRGREGAGGEGKPKGRERRKGKTSDGSETVPRGLNTQCCRM